MAFEGPRNNFDDVRYSRVFNRYAIKQETTQSLLSCPYSDNTIWEADFPGRDVLVMSGITKTIVINTVSKTEIQ